MDQSFSYSVSYTIPSASGVKRMSWDRLGPQVLLLACLASRSLQPSAASCCGCKGKYELERGLQGYVWDEGST